MKKRPNMALMDIFQRMQWERFFIGRRTKRYVRAYRQTGMQATERYRRRGMYYLQRSCHRDGQAVSRFLFAEAA